MESKEYHAVSEVITEFDELIKNPEIYTEQQHENSEKFKHIAKETYGLTVSSNFLNDLKFKSLSQLLVDGFDEEQIWQQIEIQNKTATPYFSKILPDISKDISFAIHQANSNAETAVIQDDDALNEDSNIDEELAFDDYSDSSTGVSKASKKQKISRKQETYAFDDDSDSSTDIVEASKKREIGVGITEEQEFEDESESSASMAKASKKKKGVRKKPSILYKSEVDDQFFKLSKLEEFLKVEDLKEGKDDVDMSDDEDDIDLFQDIPSDSDGINECEDESEEEGNIKKFSKDIMYEDFFDEPESGDESVSRTENHNRIINRDNENDHDPESALDEAMEDGDESDTGTKNVELENNLEINKDAQITVDNNTQKTAFEIEQKKIKKQIEECEKSMLEPLPWHLTGEVDASNRPIDSLVHHETDFDSNIKQGDNIDSMVMEKLEKFIIMAVTNNAHSSVERKFKPTAEVIAYKKKANLDQTKSQKSLAQVYEEDYLKKQSKLEEEEDPKHKEIKKLMDSLFPELHALFSHIPKPAIPDIKIVSNLPAITVEEVAPISVSDVTLLAPGEIKVKSGLVKGKTERTVTDRKRERRKKKVHQKQKEKERLEKMESQKANPSARMSKLEKLETLKKLKQNKNTKIANVDEGGKVKSSKDFFSRLQDTVDSKMKPTYKKKKT